MESDFGDNPSVSSGESAIRRLAGSCFLALRTDDGAPLLDIPEPESFYASGLVGTYANLCKRFGIQTTKDAVVEGMRLHATNHARWEGLVGLLEILKQEGIEPVVFKGGALHARWPAMRDVRALFDYDLIVPQAKMAALRSSLLRQGFEVPRSGSRITNRLNKGSMVWKGSGLRYQNLDIHARVTEPPVCSSLTRSLLASQERASGIRVPDIEDCACMIALHIVRSGMARPLREYIDLLWYVDGMDDAQWQSIHARAQRHQLVPALFLSLRQAVYCLALRELSPRRAEALTARIDSLGREVGRLRKRALDWLAPPDYPLHPIEARNKPIFRRSLILGTGTSSSWRVALAFLAYGSARCVDRLAGTASTPD